jgi:hypothetical protein
VCGLAQIGVPLVLILERCLIMVAYVILVSRTIIDFIGDFQLMHVSIRSYKQQKQLQIYISHDSLVSCQTLDSSK